MMTAQNTDAPEVIHHQPRHEKLLRALQNALDHGSPIALPPELESLIDRARGDLLIDVGDNELEQMLAAVEEAEGGPGSGLLAGKAVQHLEIEKAKIKETAGLFSIDNIIAIGMPWQHEDEEDKPKQAAVDKMVNAINNMFISSPEMRTDRMALAH